MGDDASLREDLQASLTELSNASQTSGDSGPQPGAEPSPGEQAAPTGERPAPAGGRDASGRFAPKTPAEKSVPADQQAQSADPTKVASEVAPPATPQKAPASWKPEEREGWEQMDPRHRAAVLRREAEVNQVLQQTAGARRFTEQMGQVLQPFMGMIQSEGSNPFLAVHTMMSTAHTLRHGSPEVKAQAVAQLIAQFNVPVEQLDAELSKVLNGKKEDPTTSAIQRMLDERLQPVQRFMTDLQTRGQQMLAHSAQTELEAFLSDPANEFAQDVAEEMADLLDLAARRGQVLSLQDAYKRATMAHPTISGVIANRTISGTAAQQTAAAVKARAASASLPGNGGAPVSLSTDKLESSGDLRADIVSAMQSLSKRV